MREWNGHLEIYNRPQVIKNSYSQYSLLRADVLQKTVVGCRPLLRLRCQPGEILTPPLEFYKDLKREILKIWAILSVI